MDEPASLPLLCFPFCFIKQMEVSWKQMPARNRTGIFLHCFPIWNAIRLLCQHVWTDMLIARVPRSFVSSYRDEELSIPPTRPVERNHENTLVYRARGHVTSPGSLHEDLRNLKPATVTNRRISQCCSQTVC